MSTRRNGTITLGRPRRRVLPRLLVAQNVGERLDPLAARDDPLNGHARDARLLDAVDNGHELVHEAQRQQRVAHAVARQQGLEPALLLGSERHATSARTRLRGSTAMNHFQTPGPAKQAVALLTVSEAGALATINRSK